MKRSENASRSPSAVAAAVYAGAALAAPQPQVLPPAPPRAPEVSDAVPDAKGRQAHGDPARARQDHRPRDRCRSTCGRAGALRLAHDHRALLLHRAARRAAGDQRVSPDRRRPPRRNAEARLLRLDVRLDAGLERARTSRLRRLGDHLQDRPAGSGGEGGVAGRLAAAARQSRRWKSRPRHAPPAGNPPLRP